MQNNIEPLITSPLHALGFLVILMLPLIVSVLVFYFLDKSRYKK